jgi:predicted TIM-barrel fold metal-dependent hydrolase
VVFGSDSYAHELAWELGRLLSLDIPDEVLKAILAGNMRRILSRRR